ncbi:unnamed protein product [Protopolystoma xenopodis]|uniref:Uncharacterized protein n=1 Tax=Protopolystoma xenopodis TaxID=117903 RepID=A0A3S4ZDI7_9PLAT|nr:unnamed protein product [Protopolystoma xenopodis]
MLDDFIAENQPIDTCSLQLGLNSSSDCEIAMLIGPTLSRFRVRAGSPSIKQSSNSAGGRSQQSIVESHLPNPLQMPSLLRLLAVVEDFRHGGRINALLGCSLLLPDSIDFSSLEGYISSSSYKASVSNGICNSEFEELLLMSTNWLFLPGESIMEAMVAPDILISQHHQLLETLLVRLSQIASLRYHLRNSLLTRARLLRRVGVRKKNLEHSLVNATLPMDIQGHQDSLISLNSKAATHVSRFSEQPSLVSEMTENTPVGILLPTASFEPRFSLTRFTTTGYLSAVYLMLYSPPSLKARRFVLG